MGNVMVTLRQPFVEQYENALVKALLSMSCPVHLTA